MCFKIRIRTQGRKIQWKSENHWIRFEFFIQRPLATLITYEYIFFPFHFETLLYRKTINFEFYSLQLFFFILDNNAPEFSVRKYVAFILYISGVFCIRDKMRREFIRIVWNEFIQSIYAKAEFLLFCFLYSEASIILFFEIILNIVP